MSAVAQDLGRLRDVGLAAVEHTDAPTVRPLPDALEPVEPLPFDALPQSLRPWVADVAERMQCPPDFVAVPLLVGAASLVARRLAIRPQARTEWTERGNLWALIVGRPRRDEVARHGAGARTVGADGSTRSSRLHRGHDRPQGEERGS